MADVISAYKTVEDKEERILDDVFNRNDAIKDKEHLHELIRFNLNFTERQPFSLTGGTYHHIVSSI